jgi:hypothetical protein
MGRARKAKGSLPFGFAPEYPKTRELLSLGHGTKFDVEGRGCGRLERHDKRANCCTFTTADSIGSPFVPLSY